MGIRGRRTPLGRTFKRRKRTSSTPPTPPPPPRTEADKLLDQLREREEELTTKINRIRDLRIRVETSVDAQAIINSGGFSLSRFLENWEDD